MAKAKIPNNALVFPMPVVLVGTEVEGKPNFMTVAWVTRVNVIPPMLAISVNNRHYTYEGIVANKAFSVNVPGRQLVIKTDFCGVISGRKMDKAAQFTVFEGETPGAPMIQECMMCFECTLASSLPLPMNTLFIGEVVNAYGEDCCLTEGKPDIHKMAPLLLTMPDNNYWMVGEHAGRAWSIGKQLIPDEVRETRF